MTERRKSILTSSSLSGLMDVHPLIYVGLLITAIAAVVLVRIAKDAWKSRTWTWAFAILGCASVLALMIIVLFF